MLSDQNITTDNCLTTIQNTLTKYHSYLLQKNVSVIYIFIINLLLLFYPNFNIYENLRISELMLILHYSISPMTAS